MSAENVGVLVAEDPLDGQLEVVVNEVSALKTKGVRFESRSTKSENASENI